MRLPRSNFRRLYAFAMAAGLGLGIITYGLIRVIERVRDIGPIYALLVALLIGSLIGLALCVAMKLALRQNAYDLYHYAGELTSAALPAMNETVANDEITFMREIFSQTVAAVPRAEDYPRLTADLVMARDFNALLGVTVAHLAERMPIQGAAVLLLDNERHQLYTAASWGKIALNSSFTLDARETAIGRALQEQRSVLYSGSQSSGLLPIGGGAEPPALFCLPLLSRHEPIGVLCLAYSSSDLRLNEEQKLFARGVADLLTIALQNLHYQSLLLREGERLDAFEQLNAALASTSQIELALEQVLRVAAQVTDSEHGTLLLLAADEYQVRHRIALEHGQTLPLSVVAPPVMKHGLAGWAIRERRPDIIDDTERDTRWLPVPGLAEIRSVMVVPLLYGERVLAVLTLADPQPHHYSRRALGIVTGLTAYAVNLLARMESESLVQNDQVAFVHRLLDGHLAPDTIDAIVADGTAIERLRQPQTQSVVALYSAIRNLDQLNGQIAPELVFDQIINPFICELSDLVYEHSGYLERHHDSGLVALFGYPQLCDDDSVRACRTALAMQEAIRRLRARWRSLLGRDLQVGIGLARGLVTLGTVGTAQAPYYTASGAAIAQAERLQSLARRGEILLTLDVFDSRQIDGSLRLEALEPLVSPERERMQQVYRLLPRQ